MLVRIEIYVARLSSYWLELVILDTMRSSYDEGNDLAKSLVLHFTRALCM